MLCAAPATELRRRTAAIETLAEEVAHLTALDVVEAVKKRAPSVGRASVYCPLGLLTSDRHHRHGVCVGCHKIVEFDECGCGVREYEQKSGATLRQTLNKPWHRPSWISL